MRKKKKKWRNKLWKYPFISFTGNVVALQYLSLFFHCRGAKYILQLWFKSLSSLSFFFPLVNTCACYCVWLPASKYKNPIPVAQIKFKLTKTFFSFFPPDLTCRPFLAGKKKLTVLFSKNKKLKSAHLSQLSLHCEIKRSAVWIRADKRWEKT